MRATLRADLEQWVREYARTPKDDIRHNRTNAAERLDFIGRVMHGRNPRTWLRASQQIIPWLSRRRALSPYAPQQPPYSRLLNWDLVLLQQGVVPPTARPPVEAHARVDDWRPVSPDSFTGPACRPPATRCPRVVMLISLAILTWIGFVRLRSLR
jgi:hypothetical protein